MTTITARDFNHDVGAAKRAAATEPVIITDRGRPSHVLLTFEEFERLLGTERDLAKALQIDADIDVTFPPVSIEPRIADL